MATYDLLRVRAESPRTYDLLRVEAEGQVASQKRYDLLRVRASGTVAAGTVYELHRVRAAGAVAVSVDPMPTMPLQEPGRIITVTATFVGPTPDSWLWTQTAGPAVVATVSGPQISFRCPATRDGTSVAFEVTASSGDTVSDARYLTVPIYPAVLSINGRAAIMLR